MEKKIKIFKQFIIFVLILTFVFGHSFVALAADENSENATVNNAVDKNLAADESEGTCEPLLPTNYTWNVSSPANLYAHISKGEATFTIPTGKCVGLHLSSYSYPDDVVPDPDTGQPWEVQELFDTNYGLFGSGTHTLKVNLPDRCTSSQIDLYTAKLVNGEWVESVVVSPPHHDNEGNSWDNRALLAAELVLADSEGCGDDTELISGVSVLPKTGEDSMFYYYLIGIVVIALGIYLLIRRFK